MCPCTQHKRVSFARHACFCQGPIASMGIYVDSGSIYESQAESGVRVGGRERLSRRCSSCPHCILPYASALCSLLSLPSTPSALSCLSLPFASSALYKPLTTCPHICMTESYCLYTGCSVMLECLAFTATRNRSSLDVMTEVIAVQGGPTAHSAAQCSALSCYYQACGTAHLLHCCPALHS